MVRPYQNQDNNRVKSLLKNTNYQIENTENPYRHSIVLEKESIKGILIYDEIYNRFELIYIFISKEVRGYGYGNVLMESFLKIVKEKQGKNITLEVDETNTKAICLYEKYGFQKVAIREKYYQNHNGYLMIRKM